MNRIKKWLISFICENIVVGGHCGLCGKWVPNVLLPRAWSYTVCKKCSNPPTFEERQRHIRANMAVAKLAEETDA